MARGSDVDENGNPIDPGTGGAPPAGGNTFYSIAYKLPDGTVIYQDGAGHLFTNNDMGPNGQTPRGAWQPYSGAPPSGPPIGPPPGNYGPKDVGGPANGTPPAPPAGGGAPPGGGLIDPWGEIFKPPDWSPSPDAPTFKAPDYKTPDPFKAPSYADVQNATGYQFARDEGMRAIEHSKAAGGIYNSPGTLKDLARFSTGLADQTYGHQFDMAAQTYNTNYQTQYADPYKAAYQSALDVFNPQFSAWQTKSAETQRKNEFDYTGAFDRYKFSYQQWLDRIHESQNLAGM